MVSPARMPKCRLVISIKFVALIMIYSFYFVFTDSKFVYWFWRCWILTGTEVASLLPVLFLNVQQAVQSRSVFEGFDLGADAVVVAPVRCGAGVLGFKTDALFFVFGV